MEKANVSVVIKKPVRELTERNLSFILETVNEVFGLEFSGEYIDRTLPLIYNNSRSGATEYKLGNAKISLSTKKQDGKIYSHLEVTTLNPIRDAKAREAIFRERIESAQQPPKQRRIIF